MKFNKRALALAGTAIFALSVSSQASAGAMTYSHLLIDNFKIFNGASTQYTPADFDTLTVVNGSSTFAATANQGLTANTTFDGTAGSGNADDNMSCVGTGCGTTILEDDYTQQAPVLGSFSRGDTQAVGSLLAPTGVTAHALGEGQTSGVDKGEGNSSVGTSTEFSFVLAQNDVIRFDFDATPFLNVMLDKELSAFASLNFSITITDGFNTVFSYSPGEINGAISQLSPGSKTYDPGTGSYSATSAMLSADTVYTLTIDHRVRNTFEVVPEPGTLVILSSALLGFGFMRRRNSKQK